MASDRILSLRELRPQLRDAEVRAERATSTVLLGGLQAVRFTAPPLLAGADRRHPTTTPVVDHLTTDRPPSPGHCRKANANSVVRAMSIMCVRCVSDLAEEPQPRLMIGPPNSQPARRPTSAAARYGGWQACLCRGHECDPSPNFPARKRPSRFLSKLDLVVSTVPSNLRK